MPGLHRLESAPVRWRAPDGPELEGLLLYPPPYGPDRPPPGPLPTVVDVHGGPNPVAPERRLGDEPLFFTGLHWLAEHGYLCLAADFRSAGNAGWAPVRRLLEAGDAVATDAGDVLAGAERLVAAGLADPARLGLRGFSHGALLVNWLVTQTGRFAAGGQPRGSRRPRGLPLPQQRDRGALRRGAGGRPRALPPGLGPGPRRAARTPLLLTEGADGSSPPPRPGRRLPRRPPRGGGRGGVPRYPGEDHALAQSVHRVDYLRRLLAWFDRHLRNGADGRVTG